MESIRQETPTPSRSTTRQYCTASHAWSVFARRVRLAALRARFSHAHLGSRCDIRPGFHLSLGSSACLEIGPGCVVDRGMTIECSGKITVGARTIFGHHCTIAARQFIEIGPDCLIAEFVSIRDHDHCFDRLDIPTRQQGELIDPIVIGSNVWLGAKVTVTRGVHIGDNVVVGANAVVTHDLPDNAIACGVPARVLRIRSSVDL